MTRLVLLIFISFSLTLPVYSQTVTDKSCRKVVKKIKLLESQLRQGYSLKRGEKLKKRLRKLKKQRYACYKARLPLK